VSQRHDPRLLVIGLDACDRELLEAWTAQGHLENLAKLRAEGAWTSLKTTAEVLHVSAWPSIYSGVPADRHGLYHAYVMLPGQQAPARPRPDLCPVPFVWKLLDERGKRCIVMDAFLTCPLEGFGGIQIVDWGSWTHFWKPTILPASVEREMRRFGPYPAEDHSSVGMTPPVDPVGSRGRLLKAVEAKTRVVEWLAQTQPWDFFLAVFGEGHAAGHYFWHYQDSSYTAYPQTADPQLRTALLDVYMALDRAIGTLLAYADDRTTVLVVSGDGMGPNHSGSHLLEELLRRMSLLNAPSEAGPAGARPQKRGRNLLGTIRGLVPRDLRAAVSRHLLPRSVNERLSLHWKTAGIDWARTRAFLIENANEGFVRVNLRGREPFGVVGAGAEYDDLCSSVVAVAAALTNPATGRRAASAVHKTTDVFDGPCSSLLPDVIINWDPGALTTTDLDAGAHGVLRGRAPFEVSPFYTGNHRPNAFLAGIGPAVSKDAVPSDASILSLAPTILAHFGIDAGAGMNAPVLEPFAGRAA
jgi:predicted AlkP superfamily phosphohydrolase/phosphomutase